MDIIITPVHQKAPSHEAVDDDTSEQALLEEVLHTHITTGGSGYTTTTTNASVDVDDGNARARSPSPLSLEVARIGSVFPIGSYRGPLAATGAWLLEDWIQGWGVLPCGIPSLDALLGGGFSTGEVTELYGLAGHGVTQVCLAAAATSVLRQSTNIVIYISPKPQKLLPTRLLDLLQATLALRVQEVEKKRKQYEAFQLAQQIPPQPQPQPHVPSASAAASLQRGPLPHHLLIASVLPLAAAAATMMMAKRATATAATTRTSEDGGSSNSSNSSSSSSSNSSSSSSSSSRSSIRNSNSGSSKDPLSSTCDVAPTEQTSDDEQREVVVVEKYLSSTLVDSIKLEARDALSRIRIVTAIDSTAALEALAAIVSYAEQEDDGPLSSSMSSSSSSSSTTSTSTSSSSSSSLPIPVMCIVDGVSALVTPLMGGARNFAGHACMSEISHRLRYLATTYHMACLVTNHAVPDRSNNTTTNSAVVSSGVNNGKRRRSIIQQQPRTTSVDSLEHVEWIEAPSLVRIGINVSTPQSSSLSSPSPSPAASPISTTLSIQLPPQLRPALGPTWLRCADITLLIFKEFGGGNEEEWLADIADEQPRIAFLMRSTRHGATMGDGSGNMRKNFATRFSVPKKLYF